MFTRRLLKIKIHSRRVQIFKRSLPIFAFLLASLLFLWPTVIEQKDKFKVAVTPSNAVKGAKVDMESVRFFSKDNKNQPLTVIASSVQETDPAQQIITLADPKASYKMENGVVLNSVTTYGLAFQKEEYLYFEEEVVTTTDTGWKALSTKVVCDYKAGTLESNAPIRITGPDGTLDATDGFLLYNKGDNIDFKGHTDTHITSQKDPITIISKNGLKINQLESTIKAFDDVRVTQNDQVIMADQMTLHYKKDPQEGEERIEKIIATGQVIAHNADQKVTGDMGVYNPQTGIIEMHGNVVLTEGGNIAKGDIVTVNLRTGVNSLTTEKKEGKPKERVKGTLIPVELKKR